MKGMKKTEIVTITVTNVALTAVNKIIVDIIDISDTNLCYKMAKNKQDLS